MTEAVQKEIEAIAKPGDLLAGKYLIERVLGVGGMGAVLAATHTQLDQRVAIKVLLPSIVKNQDTVSRFQREARAAAKIRSEHVVRVSDVGALDSGLPYIVMEFLEGRDLGDLLKLRGPLPIPLAIDYMLQACEALAEAHAAGIIHRDLKPGNLFLAKLPDGTEIIKVLDFGISKQVTTEALKSNPSLTKTTDIFGSPMYMSPEQLKASRDVDMRSDIWSLGVILYELLAGKTPFEGGTVAEIFGAILHAPVPSVRDARKEVPADLERALMRCLDKTADGRYSDIAKMAEALAPFGTDEAEASSKRVSRILRAPSARGSLPSIDSIAVGPPESAVSAKTVSVDPETAEPATPPPTGAATSTSWSQTEQKRRPAKGRFVAGALVIAGLVSASVVIGLKVSSGTGAASSEGTSAVPDPSSETRSSTTSVVVSPSGAPSQTGPASATPEASSAAPTSAPSVIVAPAASSSAPAKTATSSPATAATASGIQSVATAAPTAAPPAKTTAPSQPPPAGEDDEFGGRR